MRHRALFLDTLLADVIKFFLLVGIAFAGSAMAEDPATAEVAKLLVQLEDDQYAAREQAEARLVELGTFSVEPVEKAVREGGLERSMRGLNVLCGVAAKGSEAAARNRALTALQRLAETPGDVGETAKQYLVVVQQARQSFALEALTAAGAQINRDARSIEIGQAWKGSDDDLQQFAYLRDIQEVKIANAKVVAAALPAILSLPTLRSLTLKRANLSTKEWRLLGEKKELTSLHLLYVPLGEEQVAELAKMKQLAQARLYGTGITAQQTEALSKLMPTTRLDVRKGGAFLGIGIQPDILGVEVMTVIEGSAAAKAGLREGDILLQLGDDKVRTFEELQGAIGKFPPDADIAVRLLRDGEPQSLKLRLGEWE